ncbi:MAG: DUF362 domain-containing protein [Candidatus Bathyarchaeia archaeon]
MKPVVALVKSKGHYEGVFEALNLIENQISEGIKGKKKILVKPNFVSVHRQLAATHVDAVRAILDIISKYYSGKIIIGEGPSFSKLKEGLINFNFLELQKDYDVDFVDLNEDDTIEIEITDSQLRLNKFHISKLVVDSDYRISVALPKTHDCVITTLTIKNMVVGSLGGRNRINEKWKIHQGPKNMNFLLAKLALKVMPHLGVIDGFQGMEGRGPTGGDPVDLRVAAASSFPTSLDAVMNVVMGFNPFDIGYLYYLNEWNIGTINLNEIEIIGVPIESVVRKFRPHPEYYEMLKWK